MNICNRCFKNTRKELYVIKLPDQDIQVCPSCEVSFWIWLGAYGGFRQKLNQLSIEQTIQNIIFE